MFILLAVNHYNLHIFKEFILNNIVDPFNLYQFHKNNFGYKAKFLIAIPINHDKNKLNEFLNNKLVQYYARAFYFIIYGPSL